MLNRLNFMREVYDSYPVRYSTIQTLCQSKESCIVGTREALAVDGFGMLSCRMGTGPGNLNNGIDDDNDGYVDCYDIDCWEFRTTSTAFGGVVPGRQYVPTPAPSFQMSLLWATDRNCLAIDHASHPDYRRHRYRRCARSDHRDCCDCKRHLRLQWRKRNP